MTNRSHPQRYIWQLKGDIQRLKRELKDDLENHQRLIIERTASTIKAPDLSYEEYNKNLAHLESIKKELVRIKVNIDRANTKIFLLEKDLETCESQSD